VIQAKPLSGVRGALRGASSEANKGFAFIERNWYLTKRYWAWELVWVTYNIVNALSVTFIAASIGNTTPGQHWTQQQINYAILYLTIGTAIWTYVSVVFDNVTEMVTMERWEGTIEYTFMAPVSRLTHMLGACVFALLHGLGLTVVQLLVVSMFFHLDLTHANWGGAAVLLAAGSISLVGLGTVSAILPMLFTERGAQMAYIIRAIMLLVSGVYYPVSVLPGWLQAVSKITPTTYTLDGLRATLQQGKTLGSLGNDIVPLLIIGAISVPLGLFIFNQAERYAKRTGKLKRNG
jgi:ABC-2 type transport system permease protein